MLARGPAAICSRTLASKIAPGPVLLRRAGQRSSSTLPIWLDRSVAMPTSCARVVNQVADRVRRPALHPRLPVPAASRTQSGPRSLRRARRVLFRCSAVAARACRASRKQKGYPGCLRRAGIDGASGRAPARSGSSSGELRRRAVANASGWLGRLPFQTSWPAASSTWIAVSLSETSNAA